MAESSQNNKKNEQGPAEKTRKRDRSASEERLIHAGTELFSKLGFNGTTTRMIAKKADVNESLIARYFDGKEGLFVAIVQNFIEEITQQELPYAPQESLAKELDKYVDFRLMNGCEHLDFAKIIFSQALVNKKFKKKALESIPMQIDPKLVDRVQLLSDKDKLLPGTDVTELCNHLDTYLDGLFFFDCVMNEDPREEILKKANRFVTVFSKLYDKK